MMDDQNRATYKDLYWEAFILGCQNELSFIVKNVWKKSSIVDHFSRNLEIHPLPGQCQTSFLGLIKGLRPHQWSKNLLLFAALLIGGQPDMTAFLTVLSVFVLFSLLASATYLLNDLFDLASDRANPYKQNRSLASGRLRIPHALAFSVCVIFGTLVCGALLGQAVFWGLAVYLILTLSYTLIIKKVFLFDVVLLAGLYSWRVVVGAWVLNLEMSLWFLSFVMFVFLSLALVKRVVELQEAKTNEKEVLKGRGYHVDHLSRLTGVGLFFGGLSVVIYLLFIALDPSLNDRYRDVQFLWGSILSYAGWIGFVWYKTLKGTMHQDPIVFSGTNVVSLWLAMTTLGFHLFSRW